MLRKLIEWVWIEGLNTTMQVFNPEAEKADWCGHTRGEWCAHRATYTGRRPHQIHWVNHAVTLLV